MLAILGFATIAAFLVLTFSGRVSVIVALILPPVVAALIGGFGRHLNDFILAGLGKVAPVAVLLAFAVLLFSLMFDAKLFDPLIKRIIGFAGGDPVKVAIGTALLTMLVSLEGDGSSTFVIVVTTMLPVYRRIGMRMVVLTVIAGLGAGVMNTIPWGGITTRAVAALGLSVSDIFNPLIPAIASGVVYVLVASYFIGRRERTRLEREGRADDEDSPDPDADEEAGVGVTLLRTNKVTRVLNVVLIVGLIGALVGMLMEPAPLFVIAYALALLINCPKLPAQREQFEKHGKNVLLAITVVLSAGVLSGVLTQSGMIKAMSDVLISVTPQGMPGILLLLIALLGVPLSLVFTVDAYYIGILPVLSATLVAAGANPAEAARASLLGNYTTGFPLTPLTGATLVLLGLANVQLGQQQKSLFGWAMGATAVMTAVAFATGALNF